MLAYYQGEIPSDEALKSHLVLSEKFNPDSVNHFIRVFRRTIELANPPLEDYSVGGESEGAEQPTGGKPMQQPPPKPPSGANPPERLAYQKSAGRHFPIYLLNGKQADLYIPVTMSKADWELLKQQVDNHLVIAKATARIEDEGLTQLLVVENESEE